MGAVFYVGDAIEVMGKLPEKSVDLVLTSPPFLALRSYLPSDHPDKVLEGGSQATPGAYIDWLIDVVKACARVLAPHGSLCVELGDTYAGSGGAGGDYTENGLREGQQAYKGSGWHRLGQRATQDDQPPNYRKEGTSTDTGSPKAGNGWPLAKSLSLIPELFRLTLVYGTNPLTGRTTERWRLRNVKTWCRPNPPVGALGDKIRPATSDLMIFCKSSKRFFDLDAVREPYKAPDQLGKSMGYQKSADPTTNWLDGRDPSDVREDRGGTPPLDWIEFDYSPDYIVLPPGGYKGAHYAVWPPALLIEPIKAMCPEKVCRVCGEAQRRITSEPRFIDRRGVDMTGNVGPRRGYEANEPVPKQPGSNWGPVRTVDTLGWSDCGHDDWRPGLVLDPFVGSGTTLAVATGHGRDAIGIDLDARNYELALQRVGPFILERGEVEA